MKTSVQLMLTALASVISILFILGSIFCVYSFAAGLLLYLCDMLVDTEICTVGHALFCAILCVLVRLSVGWGNV